MGNAIKNLWAGLKIFFSNFNAQYGRAFNWILFILIAGILLYLFVRSALAGRRGRKSLSPLRTRTADREITEHAAEALAAALRCPTITGREEEMLAVGRVLRERYPLLSKQLDWATLPGGSILLRWRGEDPSLKPVLFCAHLDVVPGGEGWTVCEPFDGVRQEGRVYGRGATDCKGVIIAQMEGVESLMRQDFRPRRDIYFAFGCDEETGGEVGAQAIARRMEQMGLNFDMVIDEGGCIRETALSHGGSYTAAYIGMGEKRRCVYRLTASCPGGHSSQPGKKTVLVVLSEAICRIEAAQPRLRLIPIVRRHLAAAMSTYPYHKRMVAANSLLLKLVGGWVFRDDPYVSALIRSTVVPTRVDGGFTADHVLPSTATALLNARLLPGDSPETILRELESLLSDLPVEVELVNEGEESFITSEDQPMYGTLRRVLEELYPRLQLVPTLVTGAEDARHFSNLSDCILRFSPLTLGPRGGGSDHGGNEFLSEQSLGLAAEFYEAFFKKL